MYDYGRRQLRHTLLPGWTLKSTPRYLLTEESSSVTHPMVSVYGHCMAKSWYDTLRMCFGARHSRAKQILKSELFCHLVSRMVGIGHFLQIIQTDSVTQ
jgi:hypothetical protein